MIITRNTGVHDQSARSDATWQVTNFIKNSPVGAHLYELKGRRLIFREGNAAADRIFGFDHTILAGLSIEKIFPDIVGTDLPHRYKEIAQTGSSWNSGEMQHQTGQYICYYRINAFQTTPGFVAIMFTETTELKNTYSLLQESEEKFRTAFRTNPDSVNINRLSDGMYFEINEGFTQLTGYSWDDVAGRTSASINIWVDPADRKKLVNGILENGKVTNLEAKFRLKNGEIRTGLMSASLFKHRNETYILSVTRDIEEIVQARASVRDSEERFHQLAENLEDVFWLIEGEKVLYMNSAVESKFGFSKSWITENIRNIGKIIHPEDLSVFDRLVGLKFLEKGENISTQLRIIDPAGKIRWIWARLFPVFNSDNKLYRIAGIVSDVTHQKEIENELRAAKEKAQESDQLKSAFLANLSHEIRTPLNGILGFSRLLTRDEADPETRNQYIEIIDRSSDQLLHIIDDLVDISKIEAKQMTIFKRECNLNQLLDELYLFYWQYLRQEEKTGIVISRHFQLKDEESCILTDEYRLRQVMMNLLSNAVKFTSSGIIRFGYSKEKNDVLKFFVEDSGIGIAGDQADLIFEPFRQADIQNTREFGGTGLGLSISRGLVGLMGGEIWLNSVPGSGSTFYFTLPYQPAKVTTDEEERHYMNGAHLNLKGRSILIVEDDEMNFKFLQEVLSPTRIKILLACDGVQAVEETSRQKPDMVLMDIRLPVMNGLDATRRIRESGNNVPIIAQTAYAMAEDKIACLAAGCNEYISKPVERELLLSKIAHYLKKSRNKQD